MSDIDINKLSRMFGGSGSSLPPWSTEKTLSELNDNIIRFLKNFGGKDFANKIDKLTNTVSDGDKKASNEGKTLFKKISSSYDNFENATENLSHNLLNMTHPMGGASNAFSGVVEASKGLFGVFSNLMSVSGFTAGALLALTGTVKILVEYVTKSVFAYNDLLEAGIVLKGGLGDLRLAASSSAMSLEEFTGALLSSSQIVASFADDGVKTFGLLSNEVRGSLKDFGMLGLSFEQINQYISDYLDSQRMAGILNLSTDKERRESTVDFIKELTMYGAVLGKGRKQILEATATAMKQVGVIGLLGQLGNKQAKLADQSLRRVFGGITAAMGDASNEVTDSFISVMSDSFNNPQLLAYLESFGGGLFNQFQEMSSKIRSGIEITNEDVFDMIRKMGSTAQNVNSESLRTLTTLANQGDQNAATVVRLLGVSKNITEKQIEQARKSLQTPEIAKLFNNLEENLRRLKAAFQNLFDRVLIKFEPTIERLSNQLTNFIESEAFPWLENKLDALANWIIKIIDTPIGETLSNMKDALSDALSDILHTIGVGIIKAIPAIIWTIIKSIAAVSPAAMLWDALMQSNAAATDKNANRVPQDAPRPNEGSAPTMPPDGSGGMQFIMPNAKGGIVKHSPNIINTISEKPGTAEAVIPLDSGERIPVAEVRLGNLDKNIKELIELNKKMLDTLDIIASNSDRSIREIRNVSRTVESSSINIQ